MRSSTIIIGLLAIAVIYLSSCGGGAVISENQDNPMIETPVPKVSSENENSQASEETIEEKNIWGPQDFIWDVDLLSVGPADFDIDKDTLQIDDYKDDAQTWVNKWFFDDNGTEYSFNRESGKLCGISKLGILNEGIQPEKSVYSIDEMTRMADSILSYLVSADNWKRTHFYADDTHVHYFYYARLTGGYETTEGGLVFISNSGHITVAEVWFVGLFDDAVIPSIDEKKLDAKFETHLYQQIAGVSDYAIVDRVLDYKGNQLFMRYEAECDHKDRFATREQIYVPI